MTAWLGDPDGNTMMLKVLGSHLDEGGDEALVGVVSGLISLAGRLLVRLEQAGVSPSEALQELALSSWA
ncbi:MAG: hypothetical protein WCD35_08130 [Mycobacteriales bacterium]